MEGRLWESMSETERAAVEREADRLVQLSHGIMDRALAMRAALDTFRRDRRGLEIRRKSQVNGWWNQEKDDD